MALQSRTAFSLLGALGEAEDVEDVDADAIAPGPVAEEEAPQMPQRPKRPTAPPKPRPPPDVSDRLTLDDRKFTRLFAPTCRRCSCESFLATGRCDRERCYFAHDHETQRAAKQRLARRVAEERARLGWVPPHRTDPDHAHHYRVLGSSVHDGASSSSAAQGAFEASSSGLDPLRVPEWAGGQRNPFFKTRICINYLHNNGYCPHGDYCQFAHGERELRENLADEAAVLRELAGKGLRPQLGPNTPVPPQLHALAPFGFAAAPPPPPPPPGYRPPQLQLPRGYGPPPPPPGFGPAQQRYAPPGVSLPRPPPAAAPPCNAAAVGAVPMSSKQLAEYMATAAQLDDDDVPEWACCPITQVQFDDPVVAADGHTYERHAIAAWLATKGTSPMTGAALTDTRLLPNHTLAAAVRAALGEQACTGRKQ